MDNTPNSGAKINVGKTERALSVAAGSGMMLLGAKKGGWLGWTIAFLGGTLAYRGTSGHCDFNSLAGRNSNKADVGDEHAQTREIPGHGGISVHRNLTIDKSAEELYAFWRKLENLPQFMNHLESVAETDATHSHWVAKAPLGQSVSWDAEIVRDNPSELIAWRSTEGSTIPNSGSVRFVTLPENRGTEVRVSLEYQPPAGVVGALVAKLFGEEPQQQVNEDLLRFKQLMETGEITTNGREDTNSK